MVYKQTIKQIRKKTQIICLVIEKRGHFYVNGLYKNRISLLTIYCPMHENEYVTTFHNYSRSVTGCLCCSRAKVSRTLKNRRFSEETLLKMSNSAYNRPNRNGKSRSWRETGRYRKWRQEVLEKSDYKCAITGIAKTNTGDLEVHHFYSTKNHPHLIYDSKNGIVLHKPIHIAFHKKYGYGSNTLEQFCEFLLFICQNEKFMPISSQGEWEHSQGSETRAYDPKRVMKLHERLERLCFK